MNKILMTGLLTGSLLLGAASMVSADFSFTVSNSETNTVTVTDAMGNEYEVSHIVETINGETSDRYEHVPFILHNCTDVGISGIYMSSSDDDSWGANALSVFDDDYVLESDDATYGLTIHYEVDNPCDIKIEMTNDMETVFEGLNFGDLLDPTMAELYFTKTDEEGGYNISSFAPEREEGAVDEMETSEEGMNYIYLWSAYEEEPYYADMIANGGFVEDEMIGVKYFLPVDMEEYELDDESMEEGFIRYFVNEDEFSLSIMLSNDETISDVEDYEEKVREEYQMETVLVTVNDIPCVVYRDPEEDLEDPEAGKIISLAYVGEDNYIIEFNFVMDGENDYSDVVELIVASIQVLE